MLPECTTKNRDTPAQYVLTETTKAQRAILRSLRLGELVEQEVVQVRLTPRNFEWLARIAPTSLAAQRRKSTLDSKPYAVFEYWGGQPGNSNRL